MIPPWGAYPYNSGFYINNIIFYKYIYLNILLLNQLYIYINIYILYIYKEGKIK